MAASKSVDAIALLKADHDKVQDLFKKYQSASGSDRKQSLAKQICMELTIHSMIEEQIFYPACRGKIDDETLLNEAQVEHDAAKVLIAELESGGPGAEFYDAKVNVLCEEINHHIREEEKPSKGVLAQARKAKLDMKALGQRLQARKQELMKQFQADGLPAPEPRSFANVEIGIGAGERGGRGMRREMGQEARPR